MRLLRYLNTILTLLTVLLALQLWTTWSAPSSGAARGTGADAGGGAELSLVTPVLAQQAGGIPDAGGQRKEMIDLMKRQIQQTEELVALLKNGQARVRVEAAPAK
jgi:hypothetical protein